MVLQTSSRNVSPVGQNSSLNEVQFTDKAIDNFLAFVDHMSCSADTYVSLGGSNGCADQLTNWDGTQKVGLGIFYKEKKKSQSR